MDGRPTWTDCDETGDYVVPNVLSPRGLVFRPDNMDETVPHIYEFGDLPLFVVVKALPSLCCVMFHINILYLYLPIRILIGTTVMRISGIVESHQHNRTGVLSA